MKNVTYTSASAGSGKTYSQTEILADLIIGKKTLPEEVIMTTFTIAAANDLKARAKEKLIAKAQTLPNREEVEALANRLDYALIGTIDSVCNRFVSKYWYMLGLSPDIRAIEPEERKIFIRQSLAGLITIDDIEFFEEYKSFFGLDYKHLPWPEHLASIAEKMIQYDISSLNESLEYSLGLAKRFMTNENGSLLPSSATINEALADIERIANSNKDDGMLNTVKRLMKAKDGSIKFVNEILKLIKGNNALEEQLETFVEKCNRIYNGKDVYEWQEKYITRLFAIAGEWKEKYQDFKQTHHLLDYVDMESYVLDLLTSAEYADVQEEIKAQYKYIFVDEFQDCSPMQVRLFDRLSELVSERSYWVGDSKQAIYKFRGSDSNLTMDIIQAISQTPGCEIAKPLDTSYRSVPAIVDAVNTLFVPAFSGMDPATVRLKACSRRVEEAANIERSIRYLKLTGTNAEFRAVELTNYISDIIVSEKVAPQDIGILCRTNSHIDDIASALNAANIPYDSEYDARQTIVYSFVKAVLKAISDDNNQVAISEIAHYVHIGKDVAALVDDKLAWNESDAATRGKYLDAVPFIRRLMDFRKDYPDLSLGDLVETAIILLDLHGISYSLDGAEKVESTLQAVIDAAQTYESRCLKLGLAITVDGFISYADSGPLTIRDNSGGVHLLTYHRSKGLQWKYVILWSLNSDPNDSGRWDDQNYFGVNIDNENNVPLIRLQPRIVTGNKLPDHLVALCDDNHRKTIKQDNVEEAKRLMYVGMTRAADVIVLAIQQGTRGKKGKTKWLDAIGVSLDHINYQEDLAPGNATYCSDDQTHDKTICINKFKNDTKTRDISPSSICIMGKANRLEYNGCRIKIADNIADNIIGDCIHQIYRCIENCRDIDFLSNIVSSFGITPDENLIGQIVAVWDSLVSTLKSRYGNASAVYHELPFKFKEDGQIYTGSMDMVWELPEGVVLIDFKTCQMGISDIEDKRNTKGHYAGIYKGQLDCYAKALERGGKAVLDKLIFYPNLGLIEKIE